MSTTIEQIVAVAELDPGTAVNPKAGLKEITTRQRPLADILKSMLTSLSEGRITDFVAGFQSPFQFTDHALNLQFKEHQQLTEFLEKSRELFPDTVMEVFSVFQSGDAAIAEWKLRATQTVSPGSMNLRMPILLSGVSSLPSGMAVRQTCETSFTKSHLFYAKALEHRDPETTAIAMGQSAAFVGAIHPAGAVIRSISEDAERVLRDRISTLVR